MSRLFPILFLLTFHVSLAWAQVTTGTILGTVTDETGAVLPGVTITLTNTDTGLTRTVISNDEGTYRGPSLTLGNYEVQAELAGFQTGVRSGIQLTVGREAVVNIRLSIGEITERVVVQGEASLVETTSSTLIGLVDDRKIRDLPLNGRSFTQLALLQMGIVNPKTTPTNQTGNTGAKISVSGTRVTETAFLMDGLDMRGNRGTTPTSEAGVLLGVDTVREFALVSGVASAEYGGFTGGVINIVSRSGTNEFHGTVFEFHRNKSLDASNFFDNKTGRSKAPFIRNQFGFTAGGPIVEDRTFIFGSYEGLRDRTSRTATARVPDANARLGILPPAQGGNVGLSPAAAPYVLLYPEPSPGGRNFGDGRAEHIFTDAQPIDVDFFMTRFDHTFSESDSVYVRYTLDDSIKTQSEALPIWQTNRVSKNQYVGIGETKILTPSLINEFRVGYNRTHAISTDEELVSVDPSLKFNPDFESQGNIGSPGGLSSWGPSSFRGINIVLNRFEFSDNLSYFMGRHSIKFGGQFIRLQFNVISEIRARGIYSFDGMAEFLQGDASAFDGQTSPASTMGLRESIFSFFIQDDFKYTPNLTFNMGLRYEAHTNFNEVADRIANLDDFSGSSLRVGGGHLGRNPSLKNFAPRIGFAWDLFGDGKTSLRGGYGIFYDLIDTTTWVGAPQMNPPTNVRNSFANPAFPNPFGPGGPDPTPPARPDIWTYGTPNQAYLQQWSLTLQQELMPMTVVTLGYQGSRGVKLSRQLHSNTRPSQVVNGRITFNAADPLRNPDFNSMRSFRYDVSSFYHGLRIGLNRRFAEGLQFQASYTWSHAIDDSSNQGSFDQVGGAWDNLQDFPRASRANSNQDLRHIFVANFTYALPGANMQGAAGKVLGGWLVSGIVNLADGSPITARIPFGQSQSGVFIGSDRSDRPDLVSGADNNPIVGDGRDPDNYFSPDSFVLQAPGLWGNVGRNTLILPGLATFDLSLQKDTPIAGERVSLQFRAEFFNLFNRANFGTPSINVFTSSSGVPSGAFGSISNTSTDARQIQFALKLLF